VGANIRNSFATVHGKANVQHPGCAGVNASGIDVYATRKVAGGAGGGRAARAAAEDTDGPVACQVEFSLRVPAENPAVLHRYDVTAWKTRYNSVTRSRFGCVEGSSSAGELSSRA